MRILVLIFWLCGSAATLADVVVAARPIRAKETLRAEDFVIKPANVPGALVRLSDVIGQEARVALYPGRPVRPTDIGPPAVIDRNQPVILRFNRGNLMILADGRALGRGAVGDRIRVMNLDSRTTLTGTIQETGVVNVK